jgi:hypothetical protein
MLYDLAVKSKNTKIVFCPHCKKKTTLETTNLYRPFCSERCKLIDLGAWANEDYKIPIVLPDQETATDSEEDEQDPHDPA